MKKILSIVLLLFLTNCSQDNHHKVIVIQPLGNFSKEDAKRVLGQIKIIYSNTILKNNISLPKSAYYKARNRYRADSIINRLSYQVGNDSIIIGLTKKDISITKGKFKDWGVMGLGFCPGKACIVSSFRLSKNKTDEQFYKVALHELGHTQGLPHCKNKTCLMRDAEGGNPLNEEKEFCLSCKNRLKSKNWKLI